MRRTFFSSSVWGGVNLGPAAFLGATFFAVAAGAGAALTAAFLGAAFFAVLPLAAAFFAVAPSFFVSPAVLFIAMIGYPLTVTKPR